MIMRKLNKFALMGAIALTGTACFTACSSDDALGENGPSISSGETVKTQFTINVPAGGPSTRLSEDIVQGQTDPVFRGLDNINMFAFTTEVTSANAASTTPTSSYLDMGSILATGDLLAGSNAKVYYNLEIPVGVNRFFFYGEATPDADATNATNGVLTPNYPAATGHVSDIHFDLNSITTSAQNDEATTLLTQLSNVAKVSGWSDTQNTELKTLYTNFIRLKAGSVNTAKGALNMLEEGLDEITDADVATLITNIKSAITAAETALDKLTYPRNIGLPDGAIQIAWNNTNQAFELASSSDGIYGGQVTATPVADFVFPAALYYWTNSTIKVSDAIQSDNYSTYASWDAILTNLYSGENNTTVTENTQSVAMYDKINYAVGRFDLGAGFASNKVNDNNGEEVTVIAEGKTMNLVGLVVGGQKNVTFDFSTPVTRATEKSIYDNAITSTALSTTNTAVIAQTLVLETEPGQSKYFAIELENNTGSSFNGYDGVVPAGGRFYLVGRLDPSTEVKDKMDNKVFKQDYKTTAKVTINSLAHAYNTIPDLRSPQLELGLSVDLKWEEGLQANVTID